MGTFRVPIEVGDPRGERWERIEALADTGASFTWVPADVLRRLGVAPEARWEFEIADGTVIERDVGETIVRVDGEERATTVVFGDPGSRALLGAYTMEGFRLAPDPVNRRLIRVRPLAMAAPTIPSPPLGDTISRSMPSGSSGIRHEPGGLVRAKPCFADWSLRALRRAALSTRCEPA